MAASLVNYSTAAAAATQVTIVTGAIYPAGSSIIVVAGFRPGADRDMAHYYVQIVINGSNVSLTRDLITFGDNNGGIAVYSTHNIAAAVASGTNMTVRIGDTANKMSAAASCFTGLATTSTLDTSNFNPGDTVVSPSASVYTSNSSAAGLVPTAATTNANDLLIGGVMLHTNDVTAITPMTGWTSAGTAVGSSGNAAGSNAVTWVQYREVTATGSYQSDPSRGSHNYRSAMVAYKVAGGGGGGYVQDTKGFFNFSKFDKQIRRLAI